MSRVVAVDLSLGRTGVARYETGAGTVHVETIATKPDGLPAARHRRIVGPIFALAEAGSLFVVEGRIVPTNRGDDGRTGRANAALDLAELRGVFEYGLHVRHIPVARPHPSHLKKFATGRHVANKDEVLLAAERRLGHLVKVTNNNESDALWMLAMAMHYYGRPLVKLPTVQTAVLDRVQWPDWRFG